MKLSYALRALAAAAMLTGAAGAAQAQLVYGEVGYMPLNVEASIGSFNVSAKPTNVRGIIGVGLGPLAIEGMASVSSKDDTTRVAGFDSGVRTEVSSIMGVFLKPRIDIGPLQLYGRVGAARTELKVGSEKESGTNLAYGAGVSFSLSSNLTLNADYMNYYDADRIKIDGVTVGLGLQF